MSSASVCKVPKTFKQAHGQCYKTQPATLHEQKRWRRTWLGSGRTLHLDDRLADGVLLLLQLPRASTQPAEAACHMITAEVRCAQMLGMLHQAKDAAALGDGGYRPNAALKLT